MSSTKPSDTMDAPRIPNSNEVALLHHYTLHRAKLQKSLTTTQFQNYDQACQFCDDFLRLPLETSPRKIKAASTA